MGAPKYTPELRKEILAHFDFHCGPDALPENRLRQRDWEDDNPYGCNIKNVNEWRRTREAMMNIRTARFWKSGWNRNVVRIIFDDEGAKDGSMPVWGTLSIGPDDWEYITYKPDRDIRVRLKDEPDFYEFWGPRGQGYGNDEKAALQRMREEYFFRGEFTKTSKHHYRRGKGRRGGSGTRLITRRTPAQMAADGARRKQ